MSNHPRRNWRRHWKYNAEARTATHDSGLAVRFEPHPEGGHSGTVVPGTETAVVGLDVRQIARLMREAGDYYGKQLQADLGSGHDPRR